MKRESVCLAAGVVCAAMAASANALAPVATTVTINGASGSFMEFQAPNSLAVGHGEVDTNTLFFIKEEIRGNQQSWYVFFDPKCRGWVDAEITFSNTITGLFTSTQALLDTSDFQRGDIKYVSVPHTGLEKRDYAEGLGSNTLKIHWHASDPGDHIRVTTAIPEPQTYALLLAGLGVMTLVARRRKAQSSPTPA